MDNQHLSSEEEKVQRLSHLRVHINSYQINVEMGDTSSTYKIYVLICPITYTIKYVGQTCKPRLKTRLSEHIQESKRSNYKVCTWLRKLNTINQIPYIMEIGRYTKDSINNAEIKWIKLFRSAGIELKNHLDGGNQGFGYKHSNERRNKISNALRGKPKSLEHCLNSSIAHSKKVYKYTLYGEFIKEYPGASYIERLYNYAGSSINKACRRNGTAYGYAWRYSKFSKEQFFIQDKRFKEGAKLRYTKGKDIVRSLKEISRDV